MGFRAHINAYDVLSLGPIQRVLLVTDGTLTDTLEAIFGEPIGLRKVSNDIVPAHMRLTTLGIEAGELLMHRKILLFGCITGQNYVYAESDLAIDRLPIAMRDSLIHSDIPIGRLWSEQKVESLKELVSVSRMHPGDLSRYFPLVTSDVLSRTYRLISAGKPVMAISEYFPLEYPVGVAGYAAALA